MLAVTYYGGLSDVPVTEYLPVLHDGYAGQKAAQNFVTIARQAGVETHAQGLDEAVVSMNGSRPPSLVEYKKDGKFFRIIRREWK
jgi:DNA repair protein RadD